MPAIFNAARASGDDFETVMSVTTSTLEQFGMISKDTNKQMEYTNKVADVLTYVADKTAAGFSDMGTAMNYVGPISHSLDIHLQIQQQLLVCFLTAVLKGKRRVPAYGECLQVCLNLQNQLQKQCRQLD